MEDDVERSEIEAVLETRRELGGSYDAELVDAFAERVERAIATRSGAVSTRDKQQAKLVREAGQRQMVLGFVSLGTGIPITAIAGGTADLPGIIVAWAGIVGVNLAHAVQSRRR